MKIKTLQPRKQRKFLYTAPLHLRRKLLAGHLSKELKQRYKIRSFPLRKGDEVEIMRGKFKKKHGKITRVDYKYYQVFIEGITRKRTAGTETQIPFQASNLRIVSLDMADKKRVKAFERKTKKEVKIEVKKEMKKEEKK
ncbi:MAG TPA: 50S ribosomal protein L24 [archaeon]|nr:50S ribosomal protein L24 [archaeon]